MPAGHNRVPRSYKADTRADKSYGKMTMHDKGEGIFPPLREASGRHIACNDQLDCITADNRPANMAMRHSPNPIRS